MTNAGPLPRGSRKKVFMLISAIAVAVTALLAGPALADTSISGGLPSSNNFTVAAEGDAMEITITDPSAPLIQAYSASPYGASATLSSLGESLADAGAPYAPVIYGLPPLVNGLGSGGQLPTLPPLPGYVSSSYPAQPTGQEVIDGYDVAATSSGTTSVGQVSLGAQAPGAANPTMFASAQTTVNGDGSVTATAVAGADAVNFGQLFDIGNVSSTETMTVPTSGPPSLKTTVDLGTISVVGVKTGLTLDGLNVLGINTPIAVSNPVLASLNSLLAPSGVSLSLLPQMFSYTDGTTGTGSTPDPDKTLQGVTSGALQVAMQENVPSQGLVDVTYVLGRVYVSATDVAGLGSGVAPVPSTPSSTAPAVSSGSATVPAAVTSSSQSNSSTAIPATGGATTPVASTASAPSNASQSVAVAPSTAGAPSQLGAPSASTPLTETRSAAIKGPSNASIYLILVLGAIVIFAASQLVRLLAVRSTFFLGHHP
jgi:hypothetical protein